MDLSVTVELELRILQPSQHHCPRRLDLDARDEPPASVGHQHEEEVAPACIEALHQARPALVASRGRQLNREAPAPLACGLALLTRIGLHLNPEQASAHLGHQVVVGAVEQRHRYTCAELGQRLDGRGLAQVALSSGVVLTQLHPENVRAATRFKARRMWRLRQIEVPKRKLAEKPAARAGTASALNPPARRGCRRGPRPARRAASGWRRFASAPGGR